MDVDSSALSEESKKPENKPETPTTFVGTTTTTTVRTTTEQAKKGSLEPLLNLSRLLPEQWSHVCTYTPATDAISEASKFAFVCDPTATRQRKSGGRIVVVRPIKGAVIGDDDFIPLTLPEERAMSIASTSVKEEEGNGKDVAEEEMIDKSALI